AFAQEGGGGGGKGSRAPELEPFHDGGGGCRLRGVSKASCRARREDRGRAGPPMGSSWIWAVSLLQGSRRQSHRGQVLPIGCVMMQHPKAIDSRIGRAARGKERHHGRSNGPEAIREHGQGAVSGPLEWQRLRSAVARLRPLRAHALAGGRGL